MTEVPRLKYRAEVDGLRALAVLPVVAFHAEVPGFLGGFLGVDVFFVISGYLITGLIAADLDRGQFSVGYFYERRIRRILPALFVVLLFSAIAALLTLNPSTIHAFGLSLMSVIGFVSNFYFWQSTGYFGNAAELTPLLHTWSLSVEEQFYVLFPLLLSMIWSRGRHFVVLLIVILAVTSLALAEWGWRHDASANFFLAPSRGFELLLGALVALSPRQALLERAGLVLSTWAAIGSLALLLVSLYVFDGSTPHPGLMTLLPVAGTVGVLLFCDGKGPAGALLTNRYLVGIGLISYSLYLWHQPLFVFARLYMPMGPGPVVLTLMTVASFGIAWLSWRYIEQPFRNRQLIERRHVLTLAGTASVALLSLGGAFVIWGDVPLRSVDPESYQRYLVIKDAALSNRQMASGGCHFWSDTISEDFRRAFERCTEQYGKAALVIGDSNGMDLYNAVARNTLYPFVASVSRESCRAHDMIGWRPPHPCPYADLETFVAEHASAIHVVLYTQAPDRLFNATWSKGYLGLPYMLEARPSDLSELAVSQVVSYLSRLRTQSGIPVILVGMVPPLAKDPNQFDFRIPIADQAKAAYSPHLATLSSHADAVLKSKSLEQGVGYLSKMEAFEMQLPEEVFIDGHLNFSDRRHLTAAGEIYFGSRLVRHLSESGYLPAQPQ